MKRKRIVRKWLSFGIVLALVAVVFVGVPMNVSAGTIEVATDINVASMVKDIWPGSKSSWPYDSVVVGNTLFFIADNGTYGGNLWKSDGTETGTMLVKEINPGPRSSSATLLTAVGDTLFFVADDGTHGDELWKSDGTEIGTKMVKDIYPGSEDSDIDYLTAMGGKLYFDANDGQNGEELWKSDGSSGGTQMVMDINPATTLYGDSNPEYLTAVGNTLYFSASDGTHGYELWKSNGYAGGTQIVKDIGPYRSSNPTKLTAVGNKLFFTATDGPYGSAGTHGRELYVSDGTSAGTFMVKDINTHYGGTEDSNPEELTAVDDTLFFRATEYVTDDELWKSDGTEAGTVLVKDINTASYSGSYPFHLTSVDGTLFFIAWETIHGSELWKSDGTTAGTQVVKDITPGYSNTPIREMEAVSNNLFFSAYSGTYGYELWMSDGTAAGTEMVQDICPGSSGSKPQYFASKGETLYFNANDGTHGKELWKCSLKIWDMYLRSNGTITDEDGFSIYPPITNVGDTYTLDENIRGYIHIEKSGIVLDGAGYTLSLLGANIDLDGITLDSVSDVTVKNFGLIGFKSGIHLDAASHNTIEGNTITGNEHGILLTDGSTHNYFGNNTCESNSGNGIHLETSSHNTFFKNTLTSNDWCGIYVFDSSNYNKILEGTMRNNGLNPNPAYVWSWPRPPQPDKTEHMDAGVYIRNSDDNQIKGNNISSNKYQGVTIITSERNTLNGNNIDSNGDPILPPTFQCGIFLINSNHTQILHNNVTRSRFIGIWISGLSHHNTISNNPKISNNVDDGINLEQNLSYNGGTIGDDDPHFPNNNTISNNNITNNGHEGIHIYSGTSNNIIKNNVSNNLAGGIYTEYDVGNNNIIDGNTIYHNGYSPTYGEWREGICIESNYTQIINNIIFDNEYNGIYVLDSSLSIGTHHNVIKNNIIYNNSKRGIHVSDSSNNSIIDCSIYNNKENGINFSNSVNNIISDCIINNNTQNGINFSQSHRNVINNSYIFNHTENGIHLDNSNNNLIYNNKFNNTNNAFDNGNNRWNITKSLKQNIIGGHFQGGNWWHDYDGVDDGSGAPPHDEEDSLGDTLLPYNSGGNIRNDGDFHPLLESLYFIHLSDIHVNGGNDRWFSTVDWIRSLPNPPAFVLITGDMVEYAARKDSVWSHFVTFTQKLHGSYGNWFMDKEKTIPVIFCPGNHDTYIKKGFFTWNILGSPFSLNNYNKYIYPENHLLRTFGNVAIISIFSGYDDYNLDGNVWDPESDGIDWNNIKALEIYLDLLDGVYNKRDDSDYVKVLMMHHPYINPNGKGWFSKNSEDGIFFKNRDQFRQICERYNVDLILTGHIHAKSSDLTVWNLDGKNWSPSDGPRCVEGGSVHEQYNLRLIHISSESVITVDDMINLKDTIGVEAKCNVIADVYDDRGNHNGPNESGEIEVEIPGSGYSYEVLQNETLGINETFAGLYVDKEDDVDYRFVITSLANETMNLTVTTQLMNGIYTEAVYNNITMFKGSIATLYANNSIVDYSLTLKDPDGTIRKIRPSSWEGNLPPNANAGGPYETNEGTEIIFDASGTSDPDNDELLYRWDFDNDGSWDTEYSIESIATYTWFDDYSGEVTVKVSDGKETDTDTTLVTVNNVAPTVDAGNDQVVDKDSIVYFSGSFADPGTEDTHTIEWSFGDGATANGILIPTHVYTNSGHYTVILTVTDDDAGIGTDTSTITVNTSGDQSPRDLKHAALIDLENAKTGDKKVDKKLDKAIDHIQKSLNIDPKHPEKPWKKHDLWLDETHLDPKHGKKVFDEDEKAVKDLEKLMKDKKAPDSVKDACQEAIEKLLEASKILAQTAYNEALEYAGEKKVDKELDKCEKEFEKAQENLDHTKKDGTPDPKYAKAIDHYKKAWEHAQKAIKYGTK